ncbi:hypothetical protein BCF11_0869 [Collimonas sp. PA-H2]|uniref:hypothetical protein n=1 Tax=Collimonas sp. PA-H2 TaxID=1881062 RepID=UPI000C01697E|nr:hypothetical protein [Collimonas sp. PA-H2]PFH08514.1 hypothetical protein BCF11_0869 [Collimonas sp. PA-H2]
MQWVMGGFQWLSTNVEWVFSGVGLAVITLIWKLLTKSGKAVSLPLAAGGHTTNVNVHQAVNQGNSSLQHDQEYNPVKSDKARTFVDRPAAMHSAHILFIDDQTDFQLISILIKAGWQNVKLVSDVPTFNSPDILYADVIFVDIQGVGRALGFKDEGLGLAKALKTQFGNKKKIVIYSAEPVGLQFHDAWSLCDHRLSKTADPYQYMQMLDTLLGVSDD